jgi:hypothetical protein
MPDSISWKQFKEFIARAAVMELSDADGGKVLALKVREVRP